jgi:hypothetical protein
MVLTIRRRAGLPVFWWPSRNTRCRPLPKSVVFHFMKKPP